VEFKLPGTTVSVPGRRTPAKGMALINPVSQDIAPLTTTKTYQLAKAKRTAKAEFRKISWLKNPSGSEVKEKSLSRGLNVNGLLRTTVQKYSL